ncbi:MAG TPA: hypothetical protein VHE81_22495, partial [Lacipirellulaceae bacterium]|nr:hypothetical protein [Lacipirellulaceae bacterium]
MKSVVTGIPRTVASTRDRDSLRYVPSETVRLSNGQYSLRFSEAGSGHSELDGVAITRSAGDETRDADGFYLYLRDLDDGFVWSAGYQPTRVIPLRYTFRSDSNWAEISRVDHDIECRLKVFVVRNRNLELRQCRLTNVGSRPRRIEVTSYLEWVLGSQDADRNHPAFSKLFVETQFDRDHLAVIARRRPRSDDESEFCGFHSLRGDNAAFFRDAVQFETNRLRFIGRGRTLINPIALVHGSQLTGDSGPVLDPIASLRVAIALEPSQSQEVTFALGASSDRREIDDALATAGDWHSPGVHKPSAMPTDSGNGKPVPARVPTFIELLTDEKYKPATVGDSNGDSGAESYDGAKMTSLHFDNGYGGFSSDGREYVIRIRPDKQGHHVRPPMPWTNVVANEHAGFILSESGAGYTWSGNSRTNRLTAWYNDPVCDPHAEALWIRDEGTGVFWSPTPGPTPAPGDYEARHGFGYSTFKHASHELLQEVTIFMARDEPVKLTRLRIVNRSGRTRRLSLFSFVQWALGGLATETAKTVTTEYDDKLRVIRATNPDRELYGDSTAFSAMAVDPSNRFHGTITCDRTFFLGRYGDVGAPAALATADALNGRTGSGLDPCAAWQARFQLAPGDAFECTLLLGETADRDAADELVRKYADPLRTQQALAEVRQFWLHLLSAVIVETPDREIDLLVNGWLTYQNLSCRMW